MSLFDVTDIEYPLAVTVKRPQATFNEFGDYEESFITIAQEMTADIQLSLKVRKLAGEDETGVDDNTVWIMYCNPPEPLQTGDRVSDGTRTFIIDAAGEGGTHTESVMKKVSGL